MSDHAISFSQPFTTLPGCRFSPLPGPLCLLLGPAALSPHRHLRSLPQDAGLFPQTAQVHSIGTQSDVTLHLQSEADGVTPYRPTFWSLTDSLNIPQSPQSSSPTSTQHLCGKRRRGIYRSVYSTNKRVPQIVAAISRESQTLQVATAGDRYLLPPQTPPDLLDLCN